MKARSLLKRSQTFFVNSRNDIDALELDGPETPKHGGEGNKGAAGSMNHHISFPLVFVVAGAGDLYECEEDPREEENEAVHEKEGNSFGTLDRGAHSSQLADVGLQIVCRQA